MVCCAIAALLVGQLILAVEGLRERLGLAGSERTLSLATNPAVAWRFGESPQALARGRRPARRIALALGAATVTFGLGLSLTQTTAAPTGPWPAAAWCSGAAPAR